MDRRRRSTQPFLRWISVAADLTGLARRPEQPPAAAAADESLPARTSSSMACPPTARIVCTSFPQATCACAREAVHALHRHDDGSIDGRARERRAAAHVEAIPLRSRNEGRAVRSEPDPGRRRGWVAHALATGSRTGVRGRLLAWAQHFLRETSQPVAFPAEAIDPRFVVDVFWTAATCGATRRMTVLSQSSRTSVFSGSMSSISSSTSGIGFGISRVASGSLSRSIVIITRPSLLFLHYARRPTRR